MDSITRRNRLSITSIIILCTLMPLFYFAKAMQRIIDLAYKYGCQYDIIFNSRKSQMMVLNYLTLGKLVFLLDC